MQNNPVASLTRRLLANFYDFLLLSGVLFTVSVCSVAINRGEAVSHPVYYIALLAASFVFYGWFWTHDGQTLGMRTWKVKIITENGRKLTWKQAAIRFTAATVVLLPAIIGLLWLFDPERTTKGLIIASLALLPTVIGVIWMLFDPEKLAWHDKLSATRLISVKNPIKTGEDNLQQAVADDSHQSNR